MKNKLSFTLLSACLRAGFCLVLLLSAHASHGQTVKTVKLNFSLEDFDIVSDQDGCLTIRSTDPSFRFEEDFNAPSLPVKYVKVLIAPDQDYSSVTFSGDETVVKTGARMLPNPFIVATSETIQPSVHRSTEYPKGVYPENCVKYAGTSIMDGYKLLSFIVSPFRYDTHSKTISFFEDLSIQIGLISRTTKANSSKGYIGHVMNDVVRDLAINGSEIDELYSQAQLKAKDLAARSSGETVDYLIITNDTLAPAFAPLVRWKKQKGVRTEVKTVEDIYSEYTDNSWSAQIKIKHCIEDYKNQKQTRFVLLGGDAEIVPVQKCYSECLSYSHGLCTEMIPADVFYASFDGDYGWDLDGDGIVGEGIRGADGVDLMPDINLTRIPVYTIADVNAFVNKTVNYEKTPPVTEWQNRALFGGAETYHKYTVDGRDMSDSEYEGNMLYSNHFINKWNGTRIRYYDTWSDYDNGVPALSATDFQNHLADGYSFINMDCHGTSLEWWFNSDVSYFETRAHVLNCSQPSIITTSACETNWFDYPYSADIMCLSEAFLLNPNSGVVGYIGSSRLGWTLSDSLPPTSLGSSQELNSFFYDKLFSNSSKVKHFGELITKAKANVSTSDLYISARWVHFSVNPMGDCEMPVYTSTPKKMDSVILSFYRNGLYVDAGLDSCRICVMDLDNDSNYYVVRDNVSTETFYTLPDRYSVCVTKQDYVPFVMEFERPFMTDGTYCIQNETLTGNQVINVSRVMIGSDVTTEKATGPVTIEGGRTTINLGDVTIKNNFEVKRGAEFVLE